MRTHTTTRTGRTAALLALALGAALLLPSCAGFRSVTRGAVNTTHTGSPAPSLDAGTWVGAEPVLVNEWHLVAFVKPG